MREVQASDAKTHLPALLDEVERGETLIITRHGKPIARLVPEAALRRAEAGEAVARIRALRRQTPSISADEIKGLINKGQALLTFVLDASVALAMVLPDEANPLAESALDLMQASDAVVPSIWWFEVCNALVMAERRKRISSGVTRKVVGALEMLPIIVDHAEIRDVVVRLARAHRLSVYDAAYLELATRIGAPLASLDRALMKAARAEGVGTIV